MLPNYMYASDPYSCPGFDQEEYEREYSQWLEETDYPYTDEELDAMCEYYMAGRG